MQDNHLFEYAVIRIVPRVEREEFLNVGVILYCKPLRFLQTMFTVDEERLRAFAGYLDMAALHEHLCVFEKISNGDIAAGEIAKLDMASRFRWLTATRSTIVQTSKVHPGLCSDALETLTKLHKQLVLPPAKDQ
ncbi:DUF3037 domain-containing protein [Ferruginibacter sp. SUN106]|uniref:DUF3037 domain-containing protein n=1 Tax=Ferruginibacter sp. SUN106 TaxID=2978348 RepID=UPI003D36842C